MIEEKEINPIIERKYFIATATKDVFYTGNFVRSLLVGVQGMIGYGLRYHVEFAESVPYVQMMRAGMVQKFLKSDCTDLVFLDCDVGWEVASFMALLISDKDVVGGIYPKKSDKCIEEGDWPVQFILKDYHLVIEDGHIEVALVPMGFAKIKRHVLEKMVKAYPELEYVDQMTSPGEIFYDFWHLPLENRNLGGEDWGFCLLWRKLGGRCWILPNITFTHCGFKLYEGNLEDTLEKQAIQQEIAIKKKLEKPKPALSESVSSLAEIALHYGTDKIEHGYIPLYENYFSPFRLGKIKLLELGVWTGRSLRMWEEYFPNAMIYGVDIDAKAKRYETDRIKIFIGDAEDKEFLEKVIGNIGLPDIIIDDAGHHFKQQITSLNALFPYLAPEGIYTIEDLATSYSSTWNGKLKGEDTTIEYLKGLVDSVNYMSHLKECNPVLDGGLKSLCFYRSIVFLEKSLIVLGKEIVNDGNQG